MKARGRAWLPGIAVLFLAASLFLTAKASVKAAATDDTTVDFILVLDCSATMEKSDPQGLSISAAKMFVDMIPMENARIGIVGFGPNWGEESYIYEKAKDVNTFTKVAYPLSDIETEKEKEAAKNAISEATARRNEKDTYTTIGYALQAGLEMLHQGKTEKNQACIILMSDGRLTELGKEVDIYTEGNVRKSKAVNKALKDAKKSEWPVYCLELAFDIENNKDWRIPTGLYQMENIAKETGGEKFTAYSNLEVEQAFSDIFTRFFDVTPVFIESKIENGVASMDFEVEEMIAETNITVTGAGMDKVDSIELTDPNGVSKKYKKSQKSDSRIITFENSNYIMAKLIQPTAGKWKVSAYGTDGIEIKLMAIPIRELNFQLNTSWNTEEIVPKGGSVEFHASFIYNGASYSSEKFYREYPAYLEIVETGEKFEMTGGTDNYTGTITFQQSGTFHVRACVDSGYFRNDKKESGEFAFQVENLPTTAKGAMEDVNMGFQESKEIDCASYFENPDNDQLIYNIEIDKTSGIETKTDENGILTLNSGVKSGDFDIRIRVNDGNMEQDAEQSFKIHIVNQPLKEKGPSEIKKTVAYNADKIPGFLRKAVGLDEIAGEEIDGSDYFEDPDQIPAVYEWKDLEGNEVIAVEEKEPGIFSIQGKKKGTSTLRLIAKDASDPTIVFEKKVIIDSVNANSYVWNKIRWKVLGAAVILVIAAALLLLTFAGRKIHGLWDISVGGRSDGEIQIGKLGSGRKGKCTLNAVLTDLDLPTCQSERIMFKGGNNWTKPVTIAGLENAEEVEYKNVTYDQIEKKLKTATIKKGQSISFNVGGTWITLSRY